MILLLAGCCIVPGTEVYRPELTVELTGAHDGLTHVVACTWSTWGPIDAGCDDVAEAVRDGDAWRVPEWRSGGLVGQQFLQDGGRKLAAASATMGKARQAHDGSIHCQVSWGCAAQRQPRQHSAHYAERRETIR